MVKVKVESRGLVQQAGSGFEVSEASEFKKNVEVPALQASGLITAGVGITATTVGLEVSAGGARLKGGRLVEKLSITDADSQNHTITAENIAKGILINTTTSSQGTLTTPTAALIVAGHGGEAALGTNADTISMHVINDGDQLTVVTGGTGVTVVGNANIEAATSATLLFHRVSATAVKCFVIGGLT